MKNLVRQKTKAQETIDWLTEQCLTPKDEAPPRCELGRQSLRRRAVTCSACKWALKQDQLHEEIGSLIKRAAFQYAHRCPYRVIASHLVASFVVGPEAFRARGIGKKRVDPVTELKKARKHVRTAAFRSGHAEATGSWDLSGVQKLLKHWLVLVQPPALHITQRIVRRPCDGARRYSLGLDRTRRERCERACVPS